MIRDIMRLRRHFGTERWRKLKGVATIRHQSGKIRRAELHGCEAHGVGRKKIKSKGFWTKIMGKLNDKFRYALCIEGWDCEELEKRKIYHVLPDADAKLEGYLRIVDETGEGHLYPESYFILVQLPEKAQEALRLTV